MEPLEPARLAVILVNWKGSKDTIECLESLFRCPEPMRIIVCDNASGDGSVERIMGWAAGTVPAPSHEGELARLSHPPVSKPVDVTLLDRAEAESGDHRLSTRLTVVQTGGNLGFAGGNNVGARLALNDPAIDRFWFLNNDTVVEADAPTELLRGFEDDPSIGILGTTIRHYHKPDELQALNGQKFNLLNGRGESFGSGMPKSMPFDPEDIRRKTDFVCGASMAVTRAFLDRVGLMAEDYFLYYEEMDWAVRARRLFKTGFAPKAVVYHKEGASAGTKVVTAERSTLAEYYMSRSKITFAARHYPLCIPLYFAFDSAVAFKRLVHGDLSRAKAIMRGLTRMPFRG